MGTLGSSLMGLFSATSIIIRLFALGRGLFQYNSFIFYIWAWISHFLSNSHLQQLTIIVFIINRLFKIDNQIYNKNIKQGLMQSRSQQETQPQITQTSFSKSNLSQFFGKIQQVQDKQSKQDCKTQLNINNGCTSSQSQFFQIMDMLQKHDILTNQLNNLYSSSMLSLALIKYHNPYTSLHSSGYPPTPSTLVLTQQFHLQSIPPKFHFPITSIQNSFQSYQIYSIEELKEQQQEIEKECLSKYEDGFVEGRFGLKGNFQVGKVREGFGRLLAKIMELYRFRQDMHQVLNNIQQQRKINHKQLLLNK